MARTVEWLRTGLVVAALLLCTALAAFFLIGRYKARFLSRDLPHRLGVDIQQDSHGFTLSKSEHGKTLFTLHASRVVQMKTGGSAELHGVKITLYGRGDSQQQDTISGDDFSYDPASQTITGQGAVLIDVQAPAPNASQNAQQIHLKTSDLIFNQFDGHASTDQPVEFALPQLSGTAVGANYDTREGTVALLSQVVLHTQLQGKDALITASSARLNHQNEQIDLTSSALHSGLHDFRADRATVWMRPDGSADHLLAQGQVVVTGADGSTVTAPHATALFDQASQVKQVDADGGVHLHQPSSAIRPLSRDAQAAKIRLLFSAVHGRRTPPVESMQFNGNVALNEAAAGAGAQHTSLHAGTVQVRFRDGIAESAIATEAPVYMQSLLGTTKILQADVLNATLANGKTLRTLHGEGHTRLSQKTSSGETDLSQGETLDAKLSATGQGPAAVEEAVQQGKVRFERDLPEAAASHSGRPAGTDVTIANADRSEYRQTSDTVVLTGSPRIRNSSSQGSSELAAETITLHRDTGDAQADTDVQGTFDNHVQSQPGNESQSAGELTHVVAGHAVLSHAHATATFTQQPRMWQGSNSVQAPEIAVSQKFRTLIANAQGTQLVHTIVSGDARPGSGKKPQQPVRITSRKMVYNDAERRAHFTDNVTLVDPDGTIRADATDVFLKGQNAGQKRTGTATVPAGELDRIVADGNVVLVQPERRGTGQELVYTADDSKFLLTGSAGRPPRLEDKQQGTVTGEALQFLSHEDRVDVVGGSNRTVTTTHMAK